MNWNDSKSDSDGKPIHYLSASDLYAINDEVTEGEAIIRDLHLLNSAALRPMLILFGQAQFPTLIDKAAAMLHSVAYHHLFIDGNKRTALQAVTLFLQHNGCRLTWDRGTEYDFILEIAQGRLDVPQIADHLARYVAPDQP